MSFGPGDRRSTEGKGKEEEKRGEKKEGKVDPLSLGGWGAPRYLPHTIFVASAAQTPMSAAGAGSAAGASVASAVATAQANAHILKKYLDMSDKEFAALSPEKARMAWYEVLKVPKPRTSSKNMTTKLATFRNMGKKTLATLLFVRGNHHIIDLLTKNKAAEILALPVSARSELRKKRLRESSAAAAALPHKKRARALSAGTGSAH